MFSEAVTKLDPDRWGDAYSGESSGNLLSLDSSAWSSRLLNPSLKPDIPCHRGSCPKKRGIGRQRLGNTFLPCPSLGKTSLRVFSVRNLVHGQLLGEAKSQDPSSVPGGAGPRLLIGLLKSI